MDNFINAIKTIEELSEQILSNQAVVKKIDTETASLEAIEGDNKLEVQTERLTYLEKAVLVLSSDVAKQAVEVEIDVIKASIKNINRLTELAKKREKTLQKMQKLSTDLTTVIGTYKGYRMNFEKKFNKVSRDTIKLLSNENIPEEEVENEEAEDVEEISNQDEIILSHSEETEIENSLEFSTEEDLVEEAQHFSSVEPENSSEDTAAAEIAEVKNTHPVVALAKVLRNYEKLTSQEGLDKYNPKFSGVYKEMDISPEDEAAISDILNKSDIEWLTEEQVEMLKLSMPKELIVKLKRADIVSERAASNEVYAAGFLNKFRPAFTYKVISCLARIILEDEDTEEKKMKIELFFKENRDCIVKGFFGSKPEYRAFAVLSNDDLIA